MNFLNLTLLMLLGASLPAMAEPENRSSIASDEGEFERAFQREYAYLAAQREALVRQRQKVEAKTSSDLASGKKALQELAGRLAKLQAENDAVFAAVQDAEKVKREESNRGDQLQVLWRKAKRVTMETKQALRFEGGKLELSLVPPERLAFADLALLGEEAISLADSSTKLSRFRGVYLDQEAKLVESALFRLGRVAVFAQNASGIKLLGPDGHGSLREVEKDKENGVRDFLEKKSEGIVPVYLFESLQDRLTIKKPGGITESLADLVPILFLGLLFLVVAFLFSQLARI